MQILLKKLFDIREGEGLRAFLMFSYIFLVIASLLIVKPVRNSLFLTTFGVEKLPYAFILVAIISGLFIYFYSPFSRKIYLPVLILNTIVISIGLFGFFWLLLVFNYQDFWFLYVFYVWVAIFGVLLTMQFWLLANYVFNSREAKRLFGFIGAGGILGGIFGGYLTNYLAPIIGTQHMLLICIGFLIICFFLLKAIWKKSARHNYQEKIQQQKRIQQSKTDQNPLRLILNSRHLTYLAGIIGVGVIVANLVDYQYSAIATNIITNEDKLTAFFGLWLSNLSIFSLLIQLFLTRKVLQTFGVGSSLFFLPIGILIGAIAILISPALWSAILIKLSDGSFKQSINKAGIELLYLPLPVNIKNQAKAFIDVFGDNLATGIGGLLLIALTFGFGLTVGSISILIIGLIAIWGFLLYKIRMEYINLFRMAIEKRTINIDEESINFEDASVFDTLIELLNGKNERQILYALGLLEAIKKEEFLPYLIKLLKHPSSEIKVQILKMLLGYDDPNLISEIELLTNDESQNVRVEAIRYLLRKSDNKIESISRFLESNEYQIVSSTLIAAAMEIQQDKDLKMKINFRELFENNYQKYLIDEDDPKIQFMKTNAAEVIGISNDPDIYSYLNILLNDSSLKIVQAAIISAGKTRAKEFVPMLIRHLNTKIARKYAREALSEFGEDIIDDLVSHMKNARESVNIRFGIVKVLAMIGSQKSVDALIENLKMDDLILRYQTLKALNKLKVNFPILEFDQKAIDNKIMEETRNYYKIITIFYEQNKIEQNVKTTEKTNKILEARALLIRTLEEKLDNNLERIFRLLGLKYFQKDMFNAFEGIRSKKTDLRANAVEFLDNILDFNLKRFIIPIIESDSYDYLVEKSQEFFGFNISSEIDCLTVLLKGDDIWLKSCALYLLAELKNKECISYIETLKESEHKIISETASYALQHLSV